MRLFFIPLSVAYISAIFLFADSSAVSTLATFNPYSLLHIPLYGVLTFLLIFSIAPLKFKRFHPERGATSLNTQRSWRAYFLIAGLIAFVVAIADEYNQSFIPSRTASIGDVLLDLVGIILFLFLISRCNRFLHVQNKRGKVSPSRS
jgi:hypothetical protein